MNIKQLNKWFEAEKEKLVKPLQQAEVDFAKAFYKLEDVYNKQKKDLELLNSL